MLVKFSGNCSSFLLAEQPGISSGRMSAEVELSYAVSR